MKHLLAMISTFLKEQKTAYTGPSYLFKVFRDATSTVVIAWIVVQSGDRELLAYVCVGIPILSIWTGVIARGGWSLSSEIMGRTLDFILISRSRTPLTLFSKTFAYITYEMISAIIMLGLILIVVHEYPSVSNVPLLFFSLVFVIIGLATISFFFAPLVVLAGGRPGFFMGIVPFGAVLNGFIFPVDRLPFGLEVLARLLPASWAMDSIWQAIQGPESGFVVLGEWGMCILLSIIWFITIYFMCMLVEKRIKQKGTLINF